MEDHDDELVVDEIVDPYLVEEIPDDGDEVLMEPQVDQLLGDRPVDEVCVEEIDVKKRLTILEKVFFPYFYDLFRYTWGENIDYVRTVSPLNWWRKSGCCQLIAKTIFLLQVVSIILIPSLIWSRESQPFIQVFSFIRTLKVQFLVGREFVVSEPVGVWMNFYFPFVVACLFSVILFSGFVLSFTCRCRPMIWCFSFLLMILEVMYLPVLNGLLGAIVCYNYPLYRQFVNVEQCFDSKHFGFALLAIILIPPFILFSFVITWFHNEWRPVSPNILASSHNRFSVILLFSATFMLFITVFFERYAIFVLFIDFFVMLMLICLHVYYLQYYRKSVNIFVGTFLFVGLSASIVAILLCSFKLMLPFLQYGFNEYPLIVLLGTVLIGTVISTIVIQLRMKVIGLTVNNLTAPRIFQVMWRLQPEEIVVPKGDFEVEMAAKTVDAFSMDVEKINEEEEKERNKLEGEVEEEIDGEYESSIESTESEGETLSDVLNEKMRKLKRQRNLIDRVHTLYTNSMDAGLAYSDYLSLSLCLFHGFVKRDTKRAISILVSSSSDRSVLVPDYRLMFYVRLRYLLYLDKLEGRKRRLEEFEEGSMNEVVYGFCKCWMLLKTVSNWIC